MELGTKVSVPVNLDYRYVTQERKAIPKRSKLGREFFVKYTDLESEPGRIEGKRIIIAGTSEGNPENIFLAIFNPRHNVTELVWEEASTVREICRRIELDEINDQGSQIIIHICIVIVISDIQSDNPLEPSCNTPSGAATVNWNVAIRAFTLTSK